MNMTTETRVDGKIQILMKITDDLIQFYGNVHGGVIAGLMDSCIAVAINQELTPEEGASTVEMKLNYLRSVNQGTLRGEGKVIKKGRNIIVGQGEIKDEEDNLVAFGTGTFIITELTR
ncbi:hypothetical protein ASZ90_019203 [hydrocarbon metagenome]|uniref:Thioesterase domain-containing protein n=1 Tax=hydrocarbon metagenome TaxID=938273 RepID=A0A0W8E418_9ZZZZ